MALPWNREGDVWILRQQPASFGVINAADVELLDDVVRGADPAGAFLKVRLSSGE